MTRSALPWWPYLVGVAWAAVLIHRMTVVVLGAVNFAALTRDVVITTVLWGVLIGFYRAWLPWCLSYVLAALVFAAATAMLWPSTPEPSGQNSGEGWAVFVAYISLLPASYGLLAAPLTLAVGFGVALGWLWRRWRRSTPTVAVAVRSRRLVWLTAAGALWALAVVVGVAFGSYSNGWLWIPLVAPPPVPILVLAVVTVGWGAVIGGLREWAEVPVALGLGAAAMAAGIVTTGAVDTGYWGGPLVNAAVTVAAGFGLLALTLSLGVVAAGGVASLAHRRRRRSGGFPGLVTGGGLIEQAG
jgi:hypothetical protein